jgi:hypothetical protein
MVALLLRLKTKAGKIVSTSTKILLLFVYEDSKVEYLIYFHDPHVMTTRRTVC